MITQRVLESISLTLAEGSTTQQAMKPVLFLPNSVEGKAYVAVQTGGTTESINRDDTGFVCLLSLDGLTPAGARTKHLDDCVGSNGGKAARDETDCNS